MVAISSRKDDYVDVTGTLRRAQRQVENERPRMGLRLLRALDPDELNLPERLRFYYLRALAYLERQDTVRAFPDTERAAGLAQQLHHGELAARLANLIGWGHAIAGRPAMALEFHDRALQAVEEQTVRDPVFAVVVQGNRGHAYWELTNYPQACAAYRDAAERGAECASASQLGAIEWGLAAAYASAGRLDDACHHAERALAHYAGGEEPQSQVRMHVNYAWILRRLGRNDEAERHLRAAGATSDDAAGVQVSVHDGLAGVAAARGDNAAAESECAAALGSARTTRDGSLLARAWRCIADQAARGPDADRVEHAYEQAVSALANTDRHEELGTVLLGYARFLRGQGRADEAAVAYGDAYMHAGVGGRMDEPDYGPPRLAGYTRTPATNQERRQARAGGRGTPEPSGQSAPRRTPTAD